MFVKGPVELLVEVVGRGAVPAPQPAPEVDVLSDLERLSSRAAAGLRHREGSGKLYRARSRLYRNQILQVNMRLKALAEIYTMHSFAQL